MTCPICQRPTAEHSLEEAWTCLEAVAAAANELTRRACGGSIVAALDQESRRPSPGWRQRP